MKRLSLVLAILCLAVPAFAAEKKTELMASGSYLKLDGGHSVWQVGGDLLFPLTSGGVLMMGPSVVVASEDVFTRGGALLEVNVPGQSGGFFFGGSAYHILDTPDGEQDWTALVRAGIKLPVAKSGIVKVYLEQIVDGAGKDYADLMGTVALGIAF